MSNLNPMNDEQLDELIQCMERIRALEAEIASLRLTDAEREAVEKAAFAYSERERERAWLENDGPDACGQIAAILRGLLERLK